MVCEEVAVDDCELVAEDVGVVVVGVVESELVAVLLAVELGVELGVVCSQLPKVPSRRTMTFACAWHRREHYSGLVSAIEEASSDIEDEMMHLLRLRAEGEAKTDADQRADQDLRVHRQPHAHFLRDFSRPYHWRPPMKPSAWAEVGSAASI